MTAKISIILGTRPEAIKLIPVILAFRAADDLNVSVCATGQHREMLDQVLSLFNIVPDSDLNLMRPDQTLASLTSLSISAINSYLVDEKPDLVIVQGDTTTAFCAALSAFYNNIPVGHVEAGLRTWDLKFPWPEEANRVLISRLSALNFAPTTQAKQNLIHEGIDEENIDVTGNTVIDTLFLSLEMLHKNPFKIKGLPQFLDGKNSQNKDIVLITGHRRENFGDGFKHICEAIKELAKMFPKVHFVYPVHLNPNVMGPVYRILGQRNEADNPGRMDNATTLDNIHLIKPLAYFEFVSLMSRSKLILSDSGGIQEEAPSLGKPVLVMRNTTERPEAVDAGTVKLVGTDKEKIIEEVSNLLNDTTLYEKMSKAHNPYGDGRAAGRILDICIKYLSNRNTKI